MFNLTGKVALVTGGSRGIGKAIALRLAEHGMDIVVNYVRHKQDALATADEVEKFGQRCLLIKANVANESDVEAMFENIAAEFGRLDVLVSNAAVSSIGSVRAIPNYTTVGASKAALESLVRHLAVEFGPRGIRVNTISAGVVDTDALKKFPNRETIINNALQRTPLGRLITTDDVADVTLFLCSNLSDMIQGQVITVDGGYAIMG